MSQSYDSTAPATSGLQRTRLALFAVWGVLTAAALLFVFSFGTNVPYADEWEFVPSLTGHERIGPWLWQQHNEHRLPLPRLAYMALFRLTHDFRSGMILQVAALSALALGLVRLAERLRGRPHWADAFFPVSLLHVGHWENFVMGYQICFVLFCVLVAGIGIVALRATRDAAFRSGWIAGVLNLLLCLDGGFGLIAALPVSLWLAYLTAIVWRSRAKWKVAVLLVLTAFPLLFLGVYQIDYQRPAHHPQPSAEPGTAIILVTLETLTVSLGIGVGTVWVWGFAAVGALGVLTFGTLHSDPNRASSLGLAAVAVGVIALAFAIGVGRAGFGNDMGLWSRYSLLTWPLLGLAYLVWVKRGGRAGKWIPALMCAASALCFPANTQTGLAMGELVRQQQAGIETDAALGKSPEAIAFQWLRGSGQEERAIRGISLLRQAKIGAFAEW